MWQYKGGCGNIREGCVQSYISALPCIGCVGVHSGGPSRLSAADTSKGDNGKVKDDILYFSPPFLSTFIGVVITYG